MINMIIDYADFFDTNKHIFVTDFNVIYVLETGGNGRRLILNKSCKILCECAQALLNFFAY